VSFTFFTDRLGGHSQGDFSSLNLALHVGDDPEIVLRNRDLIAKDHGPIVYMNQVHGNSIEFVSNAQNVSPTCDALVTTTPGVTLAVLTADCIPLLLSSETVIAAVHVGRRGLVNGVAHNTVKKMRNFGATTIAAHLGPSICASCYEVDQVTYDEVVSDFPLAAALSSQGTLSLDLAAALVDVLKHLSITSTVDVRCTREDETLFSYRKSHRTGRQAGLIRL
jgi:YfiH family protein